MINLPALLLNMSSRRGRGRSRWLNNERGSLGSDSLNWRASEPEVLPDPNTDIAQGQQAALTGFSKIDSPPDHQDYVAYLHEAWNEVSRSQGVKWKEHCEPSDNLLPPLDLKTWVKEREYSTKN